MNYKKTTLIGGIVLLFIGNVYGVSVNKTIQDTTAYIQKIIFTDNGTPSGNANIVIDGVNSKIGIGTNNPNYNLHVIGTIYGSTNLGVGGTATIVGNIQGNSNATINGSISIGSNTYIGGNLGIGTASNGHKLYIKTNPGTNAEINIQSGNSPYWALYQDSNNDLNFWNTNSNNLLTLTDSKKVIIGNTVGASLEVKGNIKVGNSNNSCDGNNGGNMKFEGGNMKYCNGSSWQNLNMPSCGSGQYPTYDGNGWSCKSESRILRGEFIGHGCTDGLTSPTPDGQIGAGTIGNNSQSQCRINARNELVNYTATEKPELKGDVWQNQCIMSSSNFGTFDTDRKKRCMGFICQAKTKNNIFSTDGWARLEFYNNKRYLINWGIYCIY